MTKTKTLEKLEFMLEHNKEEKLTGGIPIETLYELLMEDFKTAIYYVDKINNLK